MTAEAGGTVFNANQINIVINILQNIKGKKNLMIMQCDKLAYLPANDTMKNEWLFNLKAKQEKR